MPSAYDNYRQNNVPESQLKPYQSFSGPLFPPDNRSFHRIPSAQQQPQRVPPMPKAQVLELVEKFKRGIVIVSLVGFGTLSALVLSNMHVSATSIQTTPSQTDPSTGNPSDPSAGNIFQPQQGGYGFGSDPSYQQPASRSQRS